MSEMFVIDPNVGSVVDPVRNRDTSTVKTCTYPILNGGRRSRL
jgi:hypothetical protein